MNSLFLEISWFCLHLAVDPNMGLGSWEDGVMDHNDIPFTVNTGTEVYTNCWSNVWEWGHGERAYKFANDDYKVSSFIISPPEQ